MYLQIEYIVIGCYLCFLVMMGLVFRRLNSNVSDYFRTGCRGKWWLVGSSAFMSGISAYTFTGASGVAFEAGWAVAVIYLGGVMGYLINYLFVAAWFRQLRAYTAPEIIRMRFGPATQQLYAYLGILVNILHAGVTLWAVAIFTSSIFGYPVRAVILLLGVIVIIYSTTGGSWAVMANDFIQGVIMMTMTVLISILSLHAVGGISGFFQMIHDQGLSQQFAVIHAPDEYPDRSFTWLWAVAMVIRMAWEGNSMGSAMRYFAAKDGREARRAALLAMVLATVGMLLWFIPPMTARLLYDDQVLAAALNKPAESAFAVISLNLLPNGMIGLMVVAMFAATLSTIDAGLNWNAAIMVRDIYPAAWHLLTGKPPASERAQFILGRVCTLLLGLTIISLALLFSRASGMGMFEITLNISAMVSLPLVIPLLLGLFIRHVPAWAAIAASICGAVSSATGYAWASIEQTPWSFQQKVLTNLAVGSIAFIATIPFWKTVPNAYRQQVQMFFIRMHTPVDFEKEIGQANDQLQLKLIGRFAISVGLFISVLLLLPNDLGGRLCIVSVGGFILLLGLVMTAASQRKPPVTINTGPDAVATVPSIIKVPDGDTTGDAQLKGDRFAQAIGYHLGSKNNT